MGGVGGLAQLKGSAKAQADQHISLVFVLCSYLPPALHYWLPWQMFGKLIISISIRKSNGPWRLQNSTDQDFIVQNKLGLGWSLPKHFRIGKALKIIG